MSLWLYENGISEERAIRLDTGGKNGRIVEARMMPADRSYALGAIVSAQIVAISRQAGSGQASRATARLANGAIAHLQSVPTGLSEGSKLYCEIIRETLIENSGDHHRIKPVIIRHRADADKACAAPDLLSQLQAGDIPVENNLNPLTDRFADAGYYALLQEAQSGIVAFAGGALILSPTPGMTVIDVDGTDNALTLAKNAALAAAQAIVRHDIGGSIAIDFPTLETKADRNAVMAVFDEALSGEWAIPHERTAINGFGLMQVIRKRQRPSLIEQAAFAPHRFALMILLRRAQREANNGTRIHTGPYTLHISAEAAALLHMQPHWLKALARNIGHTVELSVQSALEPAAFSLS